MVRLNGRDYSRRELLERVGRLDQIGGVEAAVLDEGPERGARALRFSGPSGLACMVLPDRGMDIAGMSWHGHSLCWHAAAGRVSPHLYHTDPSGFTRAFFGGMLTTCGLTTFGPGGEDAGEILHQHGWATFLPASDIAWGTSWDGDHCTLYARGTTRQDRLFGEHLSLSRYLRMDLDSASLSIDDVVRNEGWEPYPHMILYHCNAGFPLLDEDAHLHGALGEVTPMDDEARRNQQGFETMHGPRAGFKEQVFLTNPTPDGSGLNEVTLWNARLDDGLGLRLRWSASTLPWMFLWRMLGQGDYALGLEPANCPTMSGRAAARAAGTLPVLAPGEERHYHLELSVVTDPPIY